VGTIYRRIKNDSEKFKEYYKWLLKMSGFGH
jgi:hypothetical protein